MFYRRKYYIVKNEFVEIFNRHFNENNLPNQLAHGSQLIGRWQVDRLDGTHEIFAIWAYKDFDAYVSIETAIRLDQLHRSRIQNWYESVGGKEYVFTEMILDVRDEELINTVN